MPSTGEHNQLQTKTPFASLFRTSTKLLSLVLCLTILLLPSNLGAGNSRTIALYNVHTKETISIAYKRNGRYVPAAMKRLNWFLRDWRQNKPTTMDPALIDLVWKVHNELGSRVPAHVISAYRSPKTNKLLRRTRGGQARRSQHLLGKAIDVRFPDVPVRRLRYSALLREQGGVGYYPTSATPFVHLDTGRVRHWPRMGRQELALLFSSGRTKHRPRRGGPISRQDVIEARRANPRLAKRVAAFHTNRRNGTAIRVASNTTARQRNRVRIESHSHRSKRDQPRLRNQPRIAWASTTRREQNKRPSTEAQRLASTRLAPPVPWQTRYHRQDVSSKDTRKLGAPLDPSPIPFRLAIDTTRELQALRKQIRLTAPDLRLNDNPAITGQRAHQPSPPTMRPSDLNDWIAAPAYDDEHPEELFYRPFPIAPFITTTASADDIALRKMTPPDIARTLSIALVERSDQQTSTLRPGLIAAIAHTAQSFTDWRGRSKAPSAPKPSPYTPSPTTPLPATQIQATLPPKLGQLVQLSRSPDR